MTISKLKIMMGAQTDTKKHERVLESIPVIKESDKPKGLLRTIFEIIVGISAIIAAIVAVFALF